MNKNTLMAAWKCGEEDIPKLLNSHDEPTQVLIEWRLKHGQDL